jgi:hypothetical protein
VTDPDIERLREIARQRRAGASRRTLPGETPAPPADPAEASPPPYETDAQLTPLSSVSFSVSAWLGDHVGKAALPNASNNARRIFGLAVMLAVGLLVLALLPGDGLLWLLTLYPISMSVGGPKATGAAAGVLLLMSIWMFAGVPPWAVLTMVGLVLGGWCWADRM